LNVRVAAAIVVGGLAVGVLTSFGQTVLDGPAHAFVNSASAWLVPAFIAGAFVVTLRGGALAGLAICLLELAGYYVTAHLRGFAAGRGIVLFWLACAVVGGPLLGVAGAAWRRGWGWGGAVLAACFIAEGLWVYLHVLHYTGTAVLWLAIGAAIALSLARSRQGILWLIPLVVAGVAAEAVLGLIYTQSF
jgi:hypothetical protein